MATKAAPVRKTIVATAYSCGGLKTESDRLMNCPNGITATGTVPTPGHTLACDRSKLGETMTLRLPDGTTLTGECEDTGGAIVGDRVDIYMSHVTKARQFGRQTLSVL